MTEPLNREVLESLSNQGLHLILLPTEACNLRCVYCYEEFQYKRMEPHVIRGVKAWIERRAASLDRLSIGWFGGEPLLALDVIEDISQTIRCQVGQHPSCSYFADITTNAYLMTPSVFERLLDWGVTRFQISFDGPRDWHDRKRVRPGGGRTFDRIWGNLLDTRPCPGSSRSSSGSMPTERTSTFSPNSWTRFVPSLAMTPGIGSSCDPWDVLGVLGIICSRFWTR